MIYIKNKPLAEVKNKPYMTPDTPFTLKAGWGGGLGQHEGQTFTVTGEALEIPLCPVWPRMWVVDFEDGQRYNAYAEEAFPGAYHKDWKKAPVGTCPPPPVK